MYEKEYKALVWADYQKKKAAGSLLSELLVPTPGGLKAACEIVCERRFNVKDEIILESFFNKRESVAAYVRAIELSNADIFRPLRKYLEDPSVNTSMKNINLLAWLIDFHPRPFHPDLVMPVKPFFAPTKIVSGGGNKDDISRRSFKKQIAIYFGVIIFLCLGYLVYQMSQGANGDEDCMIWADDHFQPVYCKGLPNAVLSWPVNHKLLKDFRLITQPDTLTHYSVRKVYYASFKGRHQFFTTNGPFPLDTNRRLLPMTSHILEKYVLHIKN